MYKEIISTSPTHAVDSAMISLLGLLLLILVVWAIFVWITKNSRRTDDIETNIECKLLAFEQSLVDKVAKKNGINLDKELFKMEHKPRHKFREKIYDEALREMVGTKEDQK